ncbi:hypothetical protein CapIbe_000933 [Capra ibex]
MVRHPLPEAASGPPQRGRSCYKMAAAPGARRALGSYRRPSPLAFDGAQGHHPGGRVTLDHCGEAPGGPARGGRGRERRCLSPGRRAQRGSSRCRPVSGRPGAPGAALAARCVWPGVRPGPGSLCCFQNVVSLSAFF